VKSLVAQCSALASTNASMPTSNGSLRPMRSASGPNSSAPAAEPQAAALTSWPKLCSAGSADAGRNGCSAPSTLVLRFSANAASASATIAVRSCARGNSDRARSVSGSAAAKVERHHGGAPAAGKHSGRPMEAAIDFADDPMRALGGTS
jgi:hypothetical protein